MALWDNAACMELDRFLAARGIRFSPPTLGSTLGSPPGGNGHTAGSNHYPEWWGGPKGSTGQARDYGDRGSDCEAIARAFEPYAQGPNYIISELIWTRSKWPLSRNGIYYKRGVAYTPSFTLARQHNNHDHVAIAVGRHLPGVEAPRPAPVPRPQPVPNPPQEDDVPLHLVHAKGDATNARYLTDRIHRRWVKDGNELHRLVTQEGFVDEEWELVELVQVPIVGEHP